MFRKTATEELLNRQHQAVLATVDESGCPNTTTIFYIYDKPHIYFITKSRTRKFENLQNNPLAALTVIDPKQPIAVNLTGRTEKIEDTKQHDNVMNRLIVCAREALNDFAPIIKIHAGEFVVMQLKIEHASYTDYTKPIGQITPEIQDAT